MGAEAAVLVEGMAAMQRTKQRGSGAKAADNKNNTHLRSRGSCPHRNRDIPADTCSSGCLDGLLECSSQATGPRQGRQCGPREMRRQGKAWKHPT